MINELSKQFEELHKERKKEAKEHENARSWEMSYISYWSILEDGLKLFATAGVKERLRQKIESWNDYLNDKRNDKPKEIRNFETEYKSDKIPQIDLIELILGSMPCVGKIIEPKKKWRNRRNEIAHKAKKFSNEAKYLEYKSDILEAIAELNENITSALTLTS